MWDSIIITPFINVLLLIYHFIQSFGLAIILFTILIRLVTHPLMVQQLKGTQSMQNLQTDPRWIDMQKKYKDDKEKLSQEQLKLYKEMGVNPFSSCLPTIIQFPIIIGLYQSITHALGSSPIELLYLQQRIYPFVQKFYSSIIPIDSHFLWLNLGQPDNSLKLSFLPFAIPILAIIVVVTTYLQSRLMMPATSGPGAQGAQMAKMMNLYMPLLMGWMALTLASGLSLYFICSNIIGVIQYAALGKVNWRNLLPQPKKVDNKPASQKTVTIKSSNSSKSGQKPGTLKATSRKSTTSKTIGELSIGNPKPVEPKPEKK
jgi:YidC/Oxa1 family membrane protein insertase